MKDDKSNRAIKYILYFFIICSILSFSYAVITRKYNGDFLGVPVDLSFGLLLLNLLFSILPYILTYKLFKYFKNVPINKRVTIPVKLFGILLFIIIIWNIIITIVYGVGVMTASPYEAPPTIKLIIQILNRFNYAYGYFLYVLLTSKENKTQFILLFFIIILSLLRAGIGIFFYLGMIFFLKYFTEIIKSIKKYKITFFVSIIFLPILISLLYEVRSQLRDQQKEEMSLFDFMAGRFVGRFSSFSDSAIILQEAGYFFINSKLLNEYYFQKQVLGSIFSQKYMPTLRPEQMLFQMYGSTDQENISYMAGTNGNLYISMMKSMQTFVLNLISIFCLIYLTFLFSRLLRFDYSNEYALILLFYVLLSGVANEYAFLFFSILVFVFIFAIINTFKIIIHK